jgi:hypothetical protein
MNRSFAGTSSQARPTGSGRETGKVRLTGRDNGPVKKDSNDSTSMATVSFPLRKRPHEGLTVMRWTGNRALSLMDGLPGHRLNNRS